MLTFYDSPPSGNCYKVRLLLHQLGIPHRVVTLNSRLGETRTAEFQAKNPFGQVPVIELENGEILAESGAILSYLSAGTALGGSSPWERAQIDQWLFAEQGRMFPQFGLTRFWIQMGKGDEFAHEIEVHRRLGVETLGVLNEHLAQQPFLVGSRYTIADIACYTYTHLAPDAGFDLDPYPHVVKWFERIRAQPRFVAKV